MTPRQKLDRLVDEFVETYFHHEPVTATFMGIHSHDGELGQYDADSVRETARRLRALRSAAESEIDRAALPLSDRVDLDLLLSKIDTVVSEIEGERPFEKSHSFFLSRALNGLQYLLARNFAPLPARMPSILSRMRRVPGMLEVARNRVRNPPRVFVEIALEEATSGAAFIEEIVSALSPHVGSMGRELERAATAAREALLDFRRHLADRLHTAKGDFVLGRELFEYRLQRENLLDFDCKSLKEMGAEILARTRGDLDALAAELDGGRPWPAIFEASKEQVPSPGRLREAYAQWVLVTREFIVEKDIAALPPGEEIELIDTPVFERSIVPYAAYLQPGAFETEQRGFFYVTPIDVQASPDVQHEQLLGHNVPSMITTVVHEAYPGHHLQLTRGNQARSKMRKISDNNVFAEGWALYCEEMMYEQGFYPSPLVRLAQLQATLWRAARVIIDVGLHTGTMTFDDAVRMLVDDVCVEPPNAVAEVRRYTLTPTQPSTYLIGREAIFEMRAEVRRRDPRFCIGRFHDRLLSCGTIPPRLAREEMLAALAE
jgi:uncharacterized protein (DUF885 family)